MNKLHTVGGLRKTVALASKYAAEDQTQRWLVNQVQMYINPGEHKTTAPLKQVRYSNGYFKQRGDIFEVSIEVSDEKRAEFAAALEALLDTVAVQTQPPSPAMTSPGVHSNERHSKKPRPAGLLAFGGCHDLTQHLENKKTRYTAVFRVTANSQCVTAILMRY